MKKRIEFLILAVLIVAGFTIVIFTLKKDSGIAYVNLDKVYAEFTLTKELDKKMTSVNNTRQSVLDSLKFELEMISKKLQTGVQDKGLESSFLSKREEYLMREQQFARDKEMQLQQYNEQIFKQINQYIENYRKEKELAVILGADGQGSIMAADEKLDISTDVVAYINQQYKGAN